jgi:hypothetical protein
MKKLIALTFAMLFLTAGIAVASEFTIGGSYYVRGTYSDNVQAVPGTDVAEIYNYDHELSLNLNWQIDDATKVFARIEAADETWGTGNINERNGTYEEGGDIYLEQVWGAYTFAGTGGTLTVGKMSAAAWGTAFADQGDEAYRIKYVQPTAVGTVIGILEKGDVGETGNTATGEAGDDDTYILGFVTKAGDVNIKPLLVYAEVAHGNGPTSIDAFVVDVAFDGTFGNIGFEAEIRYEDWSGETAAAIADHELWGFYGNVWVQLDALKIGGLIAYGSEDTDSNGVNHGFRFGDDFEAGGALIMGDDITFTGFRLGGNEDLNAGSLIAFYFDYAVSEDLTFGGYLGYAECNIEDNSAYEDADVWEISFDMAYKLTDNVTYKIAAGRAELNWGTGADPDESYQMQHRLDFSF